MWIFLNDGFFSIVQHPKRAEQFQVRARKKGDLERVFDVKSNTVIKMPTRDYMYRVYLPKSFVARVLTDRILDIDYGNFKDSISKKEMDRKRAYSGVWGEMYDWQDELHPQHSTKNWAANYRTPDYSQYASKYKSAKQSADTLYDVYDGKSYKYDPDTDHDRPIMDIAEEDDDHQVLYPGQ